MASKNKNKVCLYWDNSNIYISAQQVAEDEEGFGVRGRGRIHFENLLTLPAARNSHSAKISPPMIRPMTRIHSPHLQPAARNSHSAKISLPMSRP